MNDPSMVKVKLVFRSVETHTITREVSRADLAAAEERGELFHWLQDEFVNSDMPDSDISTEIFELESFEEL